MASTRSNSKNAQGQGKREKAFGCTTTHIKWNKIMLRRPKPKRKTLKLTQPIVVCFSTSSKITWNWTRLQDWGLNRLAIHRSSISSSRIHHPGHGKGSPSAGHCTSCCNCRRCRTGFPSSHTAESPNRRACFRSATLYSQHWWYNSSLFFNNIIFQIVPNPGLLLKIGG